MPETEKSTAAGRFGERADPSAAALGPADRHDDLSEAGRFDPALFELFEQITRSLDAGMPVDVEQLSRRTRPGRSRFATWCRPCGGWPRPARSASARLRRHWPNARRRGKTRRRRLSPHPRDRPGRNGRRLRGRAGTLGRRVALKVLPLAATLDPRALQRTSNSRRGGRLVAAPADRAGVRGGARERNSVFRDAVYRGGQPGHLDCRAARFAERGSDAAANRTSGDCPSALALGLLTGRFAPSSHDGEPPGEPSAGSERSRSASAGSVGASPSRGPTPARTPGRANLRVSRVPALSEVEVPRPAPRHRAIPLPTPWRSSPGGRTSV